MRLSCERRNCLIGAFLFCRFLSNRGGNRIRAPPDLEIVKSCALSAQVVYKTNVKNAIKKPKNAIEIFSLIM